MSVILTQTMGKEKNLLVDAMPELKLEEGRSRIRKAQHPREIPQHYSIFREICNWSKSPFGGNSETCVQLLKKQAFMSC